MLIGQEKNTFILQNIQQHAILYLPYTKFYYFHKIALIKERCWGAFSEIVQLLIKDLKGNSVIMRGASKLIVGHAEVRNLPRRMYW